LTTLIFIITGCLETLKLGMLIDIDFSIIEFFYRSCFRFPKIDYRSEIALGDDDQFARCYAYPFQIQYKTDCDWRMDGLRRIIVYTMQFMP